MKNTNNKAVGLLFVFLGLITWIVILFFVSQKALNLPEAVRDFFSFLQYDFSLSNFVSQILRSILLTPFAFLVGVILPGLLIGGIYAYWKQVLRYIAMALIIAIYALIGTILLLLELLIPSARKRSRVTREFPIRGVRERYMDVLGRWNLLP